LLIPAIIKDRSRPKVLDGFFNRVVKRPSVAALLENSPGLLEVVAEFRTS